MFAVSYHLKKPFYKTKNFSLCHFCPKEAYELVMDKNRQI
jgi:hypothetical protein